MIGTVGAGFWIMPDTDDMHAECFGEGGDFGTDAPHADNQNGFTVQLVFALRQITDHAPPCGLLLIVPRFGQAA